MPGTGNTGSAFVPDTFPSLANSRRTSRLHRLRQRLLRHRLYDCLDRVADFVFAYSVLAKSEYAFVPDVRLVLAKLGQHLVLDGSDCIDFGIDHLHDCLDASPSLSSRTMRLRLHVRLPRHRHPTTTSTTASPRAATPTKVAPPNALGSLDIGTRATTSPAPHQLPLQSKHPRRNSVHDAPAMTAGECQPVGSYLRLLSSLTVRDATVVHVATATTAGEC
jgi:hypothetical protein